MGFTKKELIEFMDGLVELASEENKATNNQKGQGGQPPCGKG